MERCAGAPALQLAGDALRWRLPGDHESSGWCLRLGRATTAVQEVLWLRATDTDLTPDEDAGDWAERRANELGGQADGTCLFLTSRSLERHVHRMAAFDGGVVEALVTAGLSNALRVGDEAPPSGHLGTINVALRVSLPLEEGARLELLSLVTEAKTAALMEAGIRSSMSGAPSTGTGTDCAVVVSAAPDGRERLTYAGKHTPLGAAAGRATLDALSVAVQAWKAEFQHPSGPLIFVGGGARSGKSRFAERRTLALADERAGEAVYIATAQAFDREMEQRIARHRDDRGAFFTTHEVPVELAAYVRELGPEFGHRRPGAVLIDCLTLWLSNLYLQDLDDNSIEARSLELVDALASAPFPVIAVSNEVGLGIVPENALSRRFRDAAGRLHQRLSEAADEVHFAALGTVLRLRPGPVQPSAPQGPRDA